MSIEIYDNAVSEMIFSRVKDTKVRMLRPEETKHLFEMTADMNKDKPITLPLIAISRNPNIEILNTNKNPKSFDGFKVQIEPENDILMSVIPIRLEYQLDVYCKKQSEAEDYIREFVFLLINNPMLEFYIPYNGTNIPQSCHIKLANEIVDNSDSQQRLFKDQFTRMTLTFEIDDARLYSMPIKKNSYIDKIVVNLVNEQKEVEETFNIEY